MSGCDELGDVSGRSATGGRTGPGEGDSASDIVGRARAEGRAQLGEPWMIDAHLDLAWNALQWNRDLREPVSVLRVREAAESGPGRGKNTVALPNLHEADVRICFATLLARSSGTARPHVDYASAEQANGVAWGQLAYYRALERVGHVSLIADHAGLENHEARTSSAVSTASSTARSAVSERFEPPAETPSSASVAVSGADAPRAADTPLGVVIAMEGADPILDPDDINVWSQAGLRLLGLAHYGPGRYAGGTGTSSGLTELGRELLDLLPKAGVALDLTHLSDAAFWQAMERYDGPVHVSHGNCRALVPNQRQLTDEQIRAVAERDGVIGIALDAWMLVPGWIKGVSRPDDVHLGQVVEHIEHVCEAAGSTAHVGIGSDLDGGFGREQCPIDVDTIADLRSIAVILRGQGWSEPEISAVAHGNWMRFLRSCLPSAQPRSADVGLGERQTRRR